MDNDTLKIVKFALSVIVYAAGVIVGILLAPKAFGW